MSKKTKIGQLKIWHNSNFGKPAFEHEVESVEEAKKLLTIIANYDIYLGEKLQANAQGLVIYVGEDVGYETDDGWEEWEDDEGRDITEILYNNYSTFPQNLTTATEDKGAHKPMNKMNEEKKLIDAWDSLEGGTNYSPRTIQDWLVEQMAPAMKRLKKKYKYGQKSETERYDK